MGVQKEFGFTLGRMAKGRRNLITDVPGVKVGQVSIHDGEIHTGVTAILPHTGDIFHDKCPAASHVINGFGKSTGLVQVDELGTIETPLILTNTLSVGTASTALVRYMLERNADIGVDTGTVNPMVFECNDGYLNDIRGLHVKQEHVLEALAAASDEIEEGAAGAGCGMCCYSLKGGIGSASRTFELYGSTYTVGSLLLTNFGSLRDLTIGGDRVGERLWAEKEAEEKDKSSVIIIIATDAPGIGCHGTVHYLRHGVEGARILRADGMPEWLARVAERHTGAGITAHDIAVQNLPMEPGDYLPETLLEKLICYADKFYSKSGDMKRKPIERVRASLSRFGSGSATRFEALVDLFGLP